MVIIKYHTTVPVISFGGEKSKEIKNFWSLKYQHMLAICFYSIHFLQTCYKGFTPSDEQHPLLFSLWTIHLPTSYTAKPKAYPSMHWVTTVDKSSLVFFSFIIKTITLSHIFTGVIAQKTNTVHNQIHTSYLHSSQNNPSWRENKKPTTLFILPYLLHLLLVHSANTYSKKNKFTFIAISWTSCGVS